MASAFSHAIASVAIGRGMNARAGFRLTLAGIICSILPDADVLAFHFGIPYAHPFGHRGFTHSIVFAVLLAWMVTRIVDRKAVHRRWIIFLFLFLSTLSHSILDAFTNGGLGVAFFFPFDNSRYFFPWRPVQVSPIGVPEFFGEWGLRVIKSEFIWIWIPSLAVIAVSMLKGKSGKQNKRTPI